MDRYIEVVQKIEEKHDIIEFHEGKMITKGCRSGEIKNPFWYVIHQETNEEYYIMLCNDGVLTYISPESMKDVIEYGYTWTYNKYLGYVHANVKNKNIIYLHSFLTNHTGHGKGGDSVDHKNRKKLDNRLSNLRIVTCGENTSNQHKRKKRKNAYKPPIELGDRKEPEHSHYKPDFYSVNDLKKMSKFRDFTDEELSKIKILRRDFFVVEDNPCQIPNDKGKRIWYTTKSMSVSIIDKYNEMLCYLKYIGYDYEADFIDIKDLNLEFFLDFDKDYYQKNEDENEDQDEEQDEDSRSEIIKNKSRKIQLSKSKILEIVLWKRKLINGEKTKDDKRYTRDFISQYYKEHEQLDISANQIHRLWNRIILTETDFEDEEFEINYITYVELINTRLRQ